ncbi:MAG TPA: ComF family protein [Gammaproteobacteria bacterium]|nr:ComF family protein [Gammaproteobacteria bacterium]
MWNNWRKYIQPGIAASICLLCNQRGGFKYDICPSCERELPWNRHACRRCATPLPAGSDDRVCGHCLRHPPVWDQARSPLLYGWPLDQLIQRFKFHSDLTTGHLLGSLLANFLAADPGPRPALLIPVPLHTSRIRERGFNQAVELARPVAGRLRIPLALHVCRRVRPTDVQSRLDHKARLRNMRGAFEVTAGVAGRDVAVLDDVVTTGATVAALAGCLHAAGAARIRVWSLARAVH